MRVIIERLNMRSRWRFSHAIGLNAFCVQPRIDGNGKFSRQRCSTTLEMGDRWKIIVVDDRFLSQQNQNGWYNMGYCHLILLNSLTKLDQIKSRHDHNGCKSVGMSALMWGSGGILIGTGLGNHLRIPQYGAKWSITLSPYLKQSWPWLVWIESSPMTLCSLITYNMIKRQEANEFSCLEIQVRFHSLGNLKAVGWKIKMAIMHRLAIAGWTSLP